MITSDNFLSQIREKYPEYKDVEDEKLYNALIQKYPEYKTQVEPYKPLVANQPEQQEDIYTKTADELLQEELNTIANEEKTEAETFEFYNQNVKFGLVNPDQESYIDFKKNFNSPQVEVGEGLKFPTDAQLKITSQLPSSEQLDTVIASPENKAAYRQDSYEDLYNSFINDDIGKDYLRKIGTTETLSLDEFNEYMKDHENSLFNNKIDELTGLDDDGNPKLANIITNQNISHQGNIVSIDGNNIVFKKTNGNTMSFNVNDLNVVSSVMSELENKYMNWNSIIDEVMPEWKTFSTEEQAALNNLVLENDRDKFIKMYAMNFPSDKEMFANTDAFKNIVKESNNYFVDNSDLFENEEFIKMFGKIEPKSKEEKELELNNLDSDVKQMVNQMSFDYLDPEKLQKNQSIDAEIINQNAIKAAQVFEVIKDSSPDYYMMKIDRDQIKSGANNVYWDNMSNLDFDEIPSTNVEIPETYQKWKETEWIPGFATANYENLTKTKNPSMQVWKNSFKYNSDNSIEYDGVWVLHRKDMLKKTDVYGLQGFSPFDNLNLSDAEKKAEENKFIEALVGQQINSNSTFKRAEYMGGESGEGVQFNHFYSYEQTLEFGGRDAKFRVMGYGGDEGLTRQSSGSQWEFRFEPNDSELAEKLLVKATEGDGIFENIVDAIVDGSAYITTGTGAATQFVASIPTVLAAGIVASKDIYLDWSNGVSPYEGYKNRWGEQFKKNMQPAIMANDAGSKTIETAFYPLTLAVDGIHATADAVGKGMVSLGASEDAAWWTSKSLGFGAELFAYHYGFRRAYIPAYKASKTFLQTKGTRESFLASTKAFINETSSYKPFYFVAEAARYNLKRYTINNPRVTNSPWIQEMSKKWGYDLKKNYSLKKLEPWEYVTRKEVPRATFQILPDFNINIKVPGQYLASGKAFEFNKKFKFKKYESSNLPKFLGLKKAGTKVEYDFQTQQFASRHLPEILADFSQLNYLEFMTKWDKALNKAGIGQADIVRWHSRFLKDPQFAKYKPRYKDSYGNQRNYFDANGEEAFNKKFGKNNQGKGLPADIIDADTRVAPVGSNVIIKNGKNEIKVDVGSKENALMVVNEIHMEIAGAAENVAINMGRAFVAEVDNFIADPKSNALVARFDNSLVGPVPGFQFVSLSTSTIPESNTMALVDITNQAKAENFSLFQNNLENTAIAITKKPDGATDVHVGVIAPESEQLNLFAQNNNSNVLNLDGTVAKAADGTNIHTISTTEQNTLIKESNNLINKSTTELKAPSSFEKLYSVKEELAIQINNLKTTRFKLESDLKKMSDKNTKALLQEKLDKIDETANNLYANLDKIDEAFASGSVPIEKVYHGNPVTKEVTEAPFDQTKVSTIIEDNSPIELAKKLNPKLWKKLMQNKEYKAEPWRVATELIKGELKKNPQKLLSDGSEYVMFRRMDSEAFVIPEFFDSKTGRYYSPTYGVSKGYAMASGRNMQPKSYPEIDTFYSIATAPPKPVVKKPSPKKKPTVEPTVKQPKITKVAETVDIKKGKVKPMTNEELSQLSFDGQLSYFNKKKDELVRIAQKKVGQKDLDKLGVDFLKNKKVVKESTMIRAIENEMKRIRQTKKTSEDLSDMMSWYKPGAGNQKILQKMPPEITERLKDLTGIEKEIELRKTQISTLKEKSTDWYMKTNELKNLTKEYNKVQIDNLTEITASLEKTTSKYRADLRNKDKIGLTKLDIESRKKIIKASERLRQRINQVLSGKISTEEASKVLSGINIRGIAKYIDIKRLIAKKKKKAPVYDVDQLTYIINNKNATIGPEANLSGSLESYTRNQAYKRAMKIINNTEAKLLRDIEFAEKVNAKIPNFADSWDIITYVENKTLVKEIQANNFVVKTTDKGKGNYFVKDDTYSDLVKRVENNPTKMNIIKQYQKRIENVRKDINKQLEVLGPDEYIKYIENYIPHMWDIKGKNLDDFVDSWRTRTKSKNKRIIPTYAEGIELGLKPKKITLGEMYKSYIEANHIMARNNLLLHQLKNTKNEFNNPIAMTNEARGKIYETVTNQIDYAKKNGYDDKFIESLEKELETVRKSNYRELKDEFVMRIFGESKDGVLMASKNPVFVHKDFYEIVKPFINNRYKMGMLGEGAVMLNQLYKSAFFLGSFFHFGSLSESSIAANARWYNPIRGFAVFSYPDPITGKKMSMRFPHRIGMKYMQTEYYDDAIRHGLTRETSATDYHRNYFINMADRILRYKEDKDPLVKAMLSPLSVIKPFKKGLEKFNESLWNNYHQGNKVFTWKDTVDKLMKDFPEADEFMVKTMVAEFVNDIYGGQPQFVLPNSKINKIWNDPKYKSTLGHILLAPDWTLSVQNQFWKGVGIRNKDYRAFYNDDPLLSPIQRKTYRRYVAMQIASLVGITELANLIISQLGDEEYEPFKYGLFTVNHTPLYTYILESGLMEGILTQTNKVVNTARARKWKDKKIKKLKTKPEVFSLGKQIGEVAEPLFPLINAAGGTLLFGNAPDRTVMDFMIKERNVFGSKLSPILQQTYELLTGMSPNGWEIKGAVPLFGKLKSDVTWTDWASFAGNSFVKKWTPISFNEESKSFINTFPVGSQMSVSEGIKHIDRLLLLYAEQEAQLDIMNEYKKGFGANIKYADFVTKLEDLMPETLEFLKESHKDLNVGALYNYRIKVLRNHYIKKFHEELHPSPKGKDKDIQELNMPKLFKYANSLARLHFTGEHLQRVLVNKYKIDYKHPKGGVLGDHPEGEEFADSIKVLIESMPEYEAGAQTNIEYLFWKGNRYELDKGYKKILQEKEIEDKSWEDFIE